MNNIGPRLIHLFFLIKKIIIRERVSDYPDHGPGTQTFRVTGKIINDN